jgi:uncharacterized protein YeaO (DUF488 family)
MEARLFLKRIYETEDLRGGFKVLVDRLWPRGIKKESIDYWTKELAPSSELRTFYNHDPAKFKEFSKLYKKELAGKTDELQKVFHLAKTKSILFLTATKDLEISGAKVLYDWVKKKMG